MLGPIFSIEMTTCSRRTRQFIIRAIYGIVLLVAFWMVYESEGLVRGRSLGANANIAASFFRTFGFLQLLAVVLIGPALAAGTIAVERERRTIEYLFATDLTNREIVFGKLLAQLIQVSFIVLAGLPVLALTMLMGGVAAEQLVSVFLITISTLATVTVLSLTVSVWSPRVRDAISRVYLLLFVGLMLPSLVMPLLLHLMGYPGWMVMVYDYLSLINPFYALLNTSLGRSGVDWPSVGNAILAQGTVTIVLLGLAVWAVRRVHLKQMGKAPKKARRSIVGRRKGPGSYPVIWKEKLATRTSKGMGFIGRFCMGLIAVAVLGTSIYWSATVGPHEAGIATTVTTTFLTCGFLLLLLSRAATSVTGEREKDTWLTLLSTPLTGKEIVFGKIVGSLAYTYGFVILLCIVWGLPIAHTPKALIAFGFTLCTFGITAVFATALGVNYSLRARSTTRAIGYSLATAVFVGGGYLFCCMPMFFRGPEVQVMFAPCIPFLLAFPGMVSYEGSPPEQSFWVAYAVGNILYLVLALVIYATAAARFDAINGRTVASGS